MTLLEQIRLLIRLQALDKTMFELGKEQEALPSQIAELSLREDELTAALAAARDELADLDKRKKNLEDAVENVRSRVRRAEQRLMGAKTQREYAAATAEIEDGKDSLRENEDQTLELMEGHEGMSARVAALEAELAQATKETTDQKDQLMERLRHVQGEMGRMGGERLGLVKGIEPALLGEYDFIRSRRDGVALAAVSQGSCGVCHMGIPPQQYNELQRMDKLMSCPSCRRLIYWGDAESLSDLL